MKDLSMGLHTLDRRLEQYIRRNSHNPSEQLPPSLTSPNLPKSWQLTVPDSTNQLKSMRLGVSRFSGENSSAWIACIQRYFDFYSIADSQRLKIAYFHLDGVALEW